MFEGIIVIQLSIAAITVAMIIYYIIKRIKEKQNETFEKRDN